MGDAGRTDTPGAAVRQFNECITDGDAAGLGELMAEDHTFIDTAGMEIMGRAGCVKAWRGFFNAFPAYRNVFESVLSRGDEVIVVGFSECPGHPELDGPALWRAVVTDGKVSEWRVYEDTAETRSELGLDPV